RALHDLDVDAAGVLGAEHAGAGALDHALVDVGAGDLDAGAGDRFVADRGQRGRLGAVGAAGAPGAHLPLGGQLGQHVALEADPLLGVAPELGHVDRHAVQQGVELGLVPAQAIQAVGEAVDALAGEERTQSALHLRALVLAEVDTADLAESLTEGHVVVACGTNGAHQFTSAAIAAAI